VDGCYSLFLGTTLVIDKSWCLINRVIASLFECIKGYPPLLPAVVYTFELKLIPLDPRVKTSLHGVFAYQELQVHA